MTECSKASSNAVENLRGVIRAAFPGIVFSGPVTPVDDDPHEDFEEQRALYGALHGKKWSEIPLSFVKSYADAPPLLTEEAFAAFLPAWLIAGVDDSEIRDLLVYTFSKDPMEKDTSFMDCRMRLLTAPQKEVILAFLSRAIEVDSSDYLREQAQTAIEYVKRFS